MVTAFLGMLIVMGVFVLSVWLLMGQIPLADEKKDGSGKLPGRPITLLSWFKKKCWKR